MTLRDPRARSLVLHREVARRVAADEKLLVVARARVEDWLGDRSVHHEYATAWKALLDGPPARLLEALVEDSERMHDLRQVSPFAGVVDARERWRLLRESA